MSLKSLCSIDLTLLYYTRVSSTTESLLQIVCDYVFPFQVKFLFYHLAKHGRFYSNHVQKGAALSFCRRHAHFFTGQSSDVNRIFLLKPETRFTMLLIHSLPQCLHLSESEPMITVNNDVFDTDLCEVQYTVSFVYFPYTIWSNTNCCTVNNHKNTSFQKTTCTEIFYIQNRDRE